MEKFFTRHRFVKKDAAAPGERAEDIRRDLRENRIRFYREAPIQTGLDCANDVP